MPFVVVCEVKGVVSSFVLYSLCIRLCALVLRLYPVCTPFVPCLCRSDCRSPEVFVIRLYPFVLTPFGGYNTIRRREEYKSTKACKCAPSIVLGALWPNGITAARAVAAAPVALS